MVVSSDRQRNVDGYEVLDDPSEAESKTSKRGDPRFRDSICLGVAKAMRSGRKKKTGQEWKSHEELIPTPRENIIHS